MVIDEASLQRWSETLADMRQQRETALAKSQQEKGANFLPPDFFDVAMGSVEKIVDRWFKMQQQSWEKQPPADTTEAVGALRHELEAVVEFEVEAIERDAEKARGQMTWDEGRRAESQAAFLSVVDELQKRYQIKLDDFVDQGTPNRRRLADIVAPMESSSMQMGYSSAYGGNAMGMIIMFVVGLLLGAGPSAYFWNAAHQQETSYQEERTKMLNDQRAIEDGLAVLRDSFDQLATGKLRSLPEIENDIRDVRTRFADQRRDVNSDYARAREHVLKKTPAGERQDRALRSLADERDKRLASIDNRENAAVEPLNKQKGRLKELMVR